MRLRLVLHVNRHPTERARLRAVPAGAERRPLKKQESPGFSRGEQVKVAVGHDLSSGADVLQIPAGTKFYFPSMKKYGIVEDTCGDGGTPQDGPCWKLPADQEGRAVAWLDIYVDGKSAPKAQSDACMDALTGPVEAVRDPADGLPVDVAPLC